MVTQRSAPKPRSGLRAAKSLKGAKRNVLGTHPVRGSLKASVKKLPLRGEPAKFQARIAPTHTDAKSGWGKARTHHFKKRLAMRKTRARGALGNWRRSRSKLHPH